MDKIKEQDSKGSNTKRKVSKINSNEICAHVAQ